MTRSRAVQNWVMSAELAGMLASGWQEVERYVADDDGRTVVRLRHRTDRVETMRSLDDSDGGHEQLTFLA